MNTTVGAMSFKLNTWLDLLATSDPTPAGGSLAMVTLAGAASLASKCARLSGVDNTNFKSFSNDFNQFALDDVAVYEDIKNSGSRGTAEALAESAKHIRKAIELLEAIVRLRSSCNKLVKPDCEASLRLAHSAIGVLLVNMEANQSGTHQVTMDDIIHKWHSIDFESTT